MSLPYCPENKAQSKQWLQEVKVVQLKQKQTGNDQRSYSFIACSDIFLLTF